MENSPISMVRPPTPSKPWTDEEWIQQISNDLCAYKAGDATAEETLGSIADWMLIWIREYMPRLIRRAGQD
jgi:hypothetical protein